MLREPGSLASHLLQTRFLNFSDTLCIFITHSPEYNMCDTALVSRGRVHMHVWSCGTQNIQVS